MSLTNEQYFQGNPYGRQGIGNGSSSVQGIGSILMEQGQIGRPDKGIGRLQEKTGISLTIQGMLE